MVKVIVLLPRRADRGQEEFRRYLNEKHLRWSGAWCRWSASALTRAYLARDRTAM